MPYTTIRGGDMNNVERTFYVMLSGVFIGMALSSLVYLYSDNVSLKIQKAKTECERSLPRDQECYIIAVPPDRD